MAASLPGKKSSEVLAEQAGESKNQIFRYIRLTELIPDLLDMVDEKKLSFIPAVELSYLQHSEQMLLLDAVAQAEAMPSLLQAQRLKKYSQEGKLTPDLMEAILSEEKKEVAKITITGDRLKQYFPSSYTQKQMEDTILKLLDNWQKQQRERE